VGRRRSRYKDIVRTDISKVHLGRQIELAHCFNQPHSGYRKITQSTNICQQDLIFYCVGKGIPPQKFAHWLSCWRQKTEVTFIYRVSRILISVPLRIEATGGMLQKLINSVSTLVYCMYFSVFSGHQLLYSY